MNNIKANLTLEATTGAPALAGILAKILQDAGAKVTVPEGCRVADRVISLDGLEINFVRTVWVVDREQMRREAEEAWVPPETFDNPEPGECD